MNQDLINYSQQIDTAMRGMVRDILKRIQVTGLPGEHHFYISYSTTHPGVTMSDNLRNRYPKEITIVLQHQYWDFKVEERMFQVSLSFGGVPEKLTIPFAAMTAFADPSVKFGLQFQPQDSTDISAIMPQAMPVAAEISVETPEEASGAEIISLDTFRKK